MNALHAAQLHKEYHYIEGYALRMIPVLHGWLEAPDGSAVDPTWNPPGTEYFGVRLPLTYANYVIFKRGAYGVLDNMEMGYPLLTGKHQLTADRSHVTFDSNSPDPQV